MFNTHHIKDKETKISRLYYFRCTHYGKPGDSDASGHRNTTTSKTCCKAYISFSYQSGKWLIRTPLHLKHNHEIGKDIYVHYPRKRLLNEIQLRFVEEQLELGCSLAVIAEKLSERYDMAISSKDLHNQLASKGYRLPVTEEERVKRLMDILEGLRDSETKTKYYKCRRTDNGDLKCLSIVTQHFSDNFHQGANCIFLDITCKNFKCNVV